MKLKFLPIFLAFTFFPSIVSADEEVKFVDLLNNAQEWISILIGIVASLALLFFFWGLAKYILSAGSKESKDEGKNIMIRGIVGLFVLASIWGIVALIGRTVGVGQGGELKPPILDPDSYNL